jgi:hypothetical protein
LAQKIVADTEAVLEYFAAKWQVAKKELPMKKIALFMFLGITVVSGCSSVISKSESFYRDNPPRRIELREYTTD